MALDPIWQQQLTLVTYGNTYLAQSSNITRWVNHAIFNAHLFCFRDLDSQHLLAQHFQVWLEALKTQGVTHLSLHCSSLLLDENNPNSNVELVPYAHFIVSHAPKQKHAWIFGQELAEWYHFDQDYLVPTAQQPTTRTENLWRFELNHKFSKRIETDLQTPHWKDIQAFMQKELFNTIFAQGFIEPKEIGSPYFGDTVAHPESIALSLLPTDTSADYAHATLYRLAALCQSIATQQKTAIKADGTAFTQEDHLNYRHFSQKLDDLYGKFIVKVANHYQTAHLAIPSPPLTQSHELTHTPQITHLPAKKVGLANVFVLIFITAMICAAAYYFGL